MHEVKARVTSTLLIGTPALAMFFSHHLVSGLYIFFKSLYLVPNVASEVRKETSPWIQNAGYL